MLHPITRRRVFRVATPLAFLARTFAQQRAGPPEHVQGPKVFLDYDQAELDAAYNQAAYAPNEDQVVARLTHASELVRARLGSPKRMAYGPTDAERLDIYRTTRARAPINVFVHGGAWRGGSASASAYPAEMFVNAGAHYIVLDFVRVQDAGGSLLVMADQVRRALAWVYKNAASFGGDSGRVFVSGHSSGAHLAAVALVSDWRKDFGMPQDLIKGALLSGGIYDLKGPRLSSRSAYVKFDDATEEALSPRAPPRQTGNAAGRRLRQSGDAGIPAPESRVRRRGKKAKKTVRIDSRRKL